MGKKQKIQCSNPFGDINHESQLASKILVRALGTDLASKYQHLVPGLTAQMFLCSRCRNEMERRSSGLGTKTKGRRSKNSECCNPFARSPHVGKELRPITQNYLDLHPNFKSKISVGAYLCGKCRGWISTEEKKTHSSGEVADSSQSNLQSQQTPTLMTTDSAPSTSQMAIASSPECASDPPISSSTVPITPLKAKSLDFSTPPQISATSLPDNPTSQISQNSVMSVTLESGSGHSSSSNTGENISQPGNVNTKKRGKTFSGYVPDGPSFHLKLKKPKDPILPARSEQRFRELVQLPMYPILADSELTLGFDNRSHPIVDDEVDSISTISETLSSYSQDAQSSDDGSSDIEIEKMNISLREMGLSPIKKKTESNYRKKYNQMKDSFRSKFSSIAKKKLQLTPERRKDCADCKQLIQELKIKFDSANSKKMKYQILTCLPASLPISDIQRIFECSIYMARKASALRNEIGAFSSPPNYLGHRLPDDIKSQVAAYYKDDNNSRQLPGLRDTILIRNSSSGNKERIAKRQMLITQAELYREYKNKYPETKISLSAFALLRPKECIWSGNRGFHNQCACIIHQNFDLMMRACGLDNGLKFLLETAVCDQSSEACMSSLCSNCPNESKLLEVFSKLDDDEMVEYYHWSSTDRTEIECTVESKISFLEKVRSYIPKILIHHFLVKKQKEFKENLKDDLKNQPGTFLVTLDFAQNYSFIVQDAVQGFHWTHQQATVHPFYVLYYDYVKDVVQHRTYVVISDELRHTTNVVYAFQTKFMELLKADFPHLRKIVYFSDGCAGQYKNFKNFMNLLFHSSDFGVKAHWEFFPTAHGKGPSDAASAIVKQSTRLESLRRKPSEPKILTPVDMFNHCQKKLASTTMKFIYVEKEYVKTLEGMLEARYKNGRTVSRTQLLHSFRPISPTSAETRSYSSQPECKMFTLGKKKSKILFPMVSDYVAVIFQRDYQFGVVTESDELEGQIRISFFKRNQKQNNVNWPKTPVLHWISIEDYLCNITTPVPTTKTERVFKLMVSDVEKVERIFTALKKKAK